MVTNNAQICHLAMNSFPQCWQPSFMRGDAGQCNDATLQHMPFEQATKAKAKVTLLKGTKKTTNRHDGRGDRANNRRGRGKN